MNAMEDIGIDDWTPKPKVLVIPKSEWRQRQNNGNHNQRPGLDDIRKIKMFLKRKYPDREIMDVFDISQKTLDGIKTNTYKPVGNLLEN